MIKGVIFDMDGVLVDNRDAHIEAFTRPVSYTHLTLPTSDLV